MNHLRRNGNRVFGIAIVAAVCLLASAAVGQASIIEAVGTAERLTEGPYAGWYKYSYQVTWDLDKGLSHVDVVHKPGCLDDDHIILFDSDQAGGPDGMSTGDDWEPGGPVSLTVPWQGSFEGGGDASTGVTAPLVKWEPAAGEPGKQGTGLFWYYANILPQFGIVDDVIVGKAGPHVVPGDLDGAYPSCNTVNTPEPASIVLMLCGAAGAAFLRPRGRRA